MTGKLTAKYFAGGLIMDYSHNMHGAPVAFELALKHNHQARSCFESLSQEERLKVLSYMQISSTGEECERRVRTAVDGLAKRKLSFL
jgi:hypothetical protein